MKRITAIACTALLLASGTSLAAANLLRVTKTVVINAPAAKVWDEVKDFDGLNNWHPAVATDQIVSGTNNKVGAVRLLTLKGGGTIKEELTYFNAAGRKFRYKIVEGVLPVSDYSSTFVVRSIGKNKSRATWSGRFKRKDTSAQPAAKEDDKTAIDAVTGVYQSGLDNLQKVLETK